MCCRLNITLTSLSGMSSAIGVTITLSSQLVLARQTLSWTLNILWLVSFYFSETAVSILWDFSKNRTIDCENNRMYSSISGYEKLRSRAEMAETFGIGFPKMICDVTGKTQSVKRNKESRNHVSSVSLLLWWHYASHLSIVYFTQTQNEFTNILNKIDCLALKYKPVFLWVFFEYH